MIIFTVYRTLEQQLLAERQPPLDNKDDKPRKPSVIDKLKQPLPERDANVRVKSMMQKHSREER